LGNIEVRSALFGFYVDGQLVQTSQDEEILHNELALKITATNLSGGASYRAYEADIGGFGVGSKLSWNAQAYLGYRTMVAHHPTVLRIEYRALSQDYESDDFTGSNKFKSDVVQHGPVIGFSMQF
jgi:hypothetical protein